MNQALLARKANCFCTQHLGKTFVKSGVNDAEEQQIHAQFLPALSIQLAQWQLRERSTTITEVSHTNSEIQPCRGEQQKNAKGPIKLFSSLKRDKVIKHRDTLYVKTQSKRCFPTEHTGKSSTPLTTQGEEMKSSLTRQL